MWRSSRKPITRAPPSGAPSAALELRLALGDERLVRLAEVARRHADLLRLRLGLERLLERHAGLAVEHLLGHAEREQRTGGQLLGERARRRYHRVGRDHRIG